MDIDVRSKNHSSPWGIASGAEDAGRYPEFNPMLRDAGVTWLRYFPEWTTIQPNEGEWDWTFSDAFVADARQNGITLAGTFIYFAKWSSSEPGNTRRFPVGDMKYWRDYVREVSSRYRDEIQYWEVWNEPNSPAFNQRGTPGDYAAMVRAAYEEARKANPKAKVGIGVAAFDLHWLEQVIKAGAAGHFDYVCVHPYNNVGLVFGSEQSFLGLAGSVRKMLASNGQRADIEIWMSEIGLTTTADPAKLARQAEALAKAYVLGIAQGFDKVFWFEAMGPKYGEGVHAIIADDGTQYPAYDAFKAMTAALGPTPRYLGWLNLGESSYGFVFDTGAGPALAIWAAKPGAKATFGASVTAIDIIGRASSHAANAPVELGTAPIFIKGIPCELVEQAKRNKPVRFPWVADYSTAEMVVARLGETNDERGLRQGNNDPRADGLTVPGTFKGEGYRRTDLVNARPFIYFEVDPSFMGWGDRECEITVVARRADPSRPSTMTVVYESETGYHEYGRRTFFPGMNRESMYESEAHRIPELWYLPPGEAWHEHTWHISDARFIGKWGWTFQINVEMSAGDVWVKEVRVRRVKK